MSYSIEIVVEHDHLRCTAGGEETLENVLSAWREVSSACEKHRCKKVLVDGFLKGDGPLLEIYDFGKKFHELGMPIGSRIAVVCAEEDLEKMKFAENVVATRAPVTAKVFLDRDEALEWLSQASP